MSYATLSSAPRAGVRAPRIPHLVAADETSLADVETLLTSLPARSTGRVFIEIPDASWQRPLAAPAHMTVTWLDRAARSGAPGTGRACAPGEALARAVTAWADETMCEPDDATRVFLLGGYLGTADIVDHLVDRLAIAREAIRTPERFGLATAAA